MTGVKISKKICLFGVRIFSQVARVKEKDVIIPGSIEKGESRYADCYEEMLKNERKMPSENELGNNLKNKNNLH